MAPNQTTVTPCPVLESDNSVSTGDFDISPDECFDFLADEDISFIGNLYHDNDEGLLNFFEDVFIDGVLSPDLSLPDAVAVDIEIDERPERKPEPGKYFYTLIIFVNLLIILFSEDGMD